MFGQEKIPFSESLEQDNFRFNVFLSILTRLLFYVAEEDFYFESPAFLCGLFAAWLRVVL